MSFELVYKDSKTAARAGLLRTSHAVLETPLFMPVGTQGAIKGVSWELLTSQNIRMVLANLYHLYLRPGPKVIQKMGGLHKFTGWPYALLTDSGGYQVFSLAAYRKIEEEGVVFRSHIDGSLHKLTPRSVIETQRILGSDIVMPLDECPPYPCSRRYIKEALLRTQKWLEESVLYFRDTSSMYGHSQLLFPILQGGVEKDLRRWALELSTSIETVGYALGGLSVGEPAESMYEVLEDLTPYLPSHCARYLMGVGRPENILEAIERGIDMFDCVMPTRNGRNGMLFTTQGVIHIRNERWKTSEEPIDSQLRESSVSTSYSRAYLRHLFVSGEQLGQQIASLHNISFYMFLLKEARKHILAHTFSTWKKQMTAQVTQKL